MSENKKIKVLVVPSDQSGCGFYRSVRPHTKLEELYGDEFEVTIEYNPVWKNLEWVNSFDIIHLHKGVFHNMDDFYATMADFKSKGGIVIIDIDDNWNVGQFHPQFLSIRNSRIPEYITRNLGEVADYVTTTTSLFAERLSKYNKNTKVFVNAIDPNEEQFIPNPEPNPSGRIRIGFIMGSSHERDMEQFRGVVNCLGKDIIDKVQFVLCGYDLRGTMRQIFPDGHVEERDIKPLESVWYKYEVNVTDNYKIVSPEYKNFLQMFIPNAEWPNVNNEAYRRVWTKDISEYATHYNTLDVLLAPLDTTEFNYCKSELKLIEGGFFSKAVVCSNFGPYTIGTKSMLQKGGVVDPEGNCILIEPSQKHKAWSKAIKKLVENPEMITTLGKNLHDSIVEKYDLSNVTKERADWYKTIIKK